MYASPLCCLYEDPVELYFTFREMYQRFWFRLHSVSSHPQGAVSLCLQFEQLLQYNETPLWQHCLSLGIQLLPIAFRWILRAFSGYLCPEQLLHLWDIILAWSSLEILPTLAAVLADLSTIKVIPLIKLALSGDKTREFDP
ncbi:TBC1 domain family member 19 [Armadillidium vulgare]|nr:TBC1 domain family member 19 [Armadillidium vulgare]